MGVLAMEKQIPKFYETFIPILKVLSKEDVLHINDLRIKVQDEFYSDLPQELLTEKTKSGDILILNRIAWGKAYLKQAQMIHQPSRGMVQITEKGKKVCEKGALTLKELVNDPDYIANQRDTKSKKNIIEETISEASPEDLIDSGFRIIENQIKIELLMKLKNLNPYYFEKVVLIMLEKMGYGDFVGTPKSGDGGIDGIISEDKLGLDKIYVQAKRYADNKVRETDIRNFIGAMSRDTHKGVFVTTSDFDEKAIQKAKDAQQKIVLINGDYLVDLMLKYGVGTQIKNMYQVKEIDEDFFEES